MIKLKQLVPENYMGEYPKRGYIGVVHDGQVEGIDRPVDNVMHIDHSEIRNAFHGRFRYFFNGNIVKWTDEPLPGEVEIVNNWLAKKDVTPRKHVLYVDPTRAIREMDDSEEIDKDRLFYNDHYLDDVAEQFGYDDDFTKQFWSQHYIPTLYHCTTPENYEKIRASGELKMKNERRGATSNRHIGAAVFTTAEELEVDFFKQYYGPVVLAIDAKQMKADGFTPTVAMEPDVERAVKLEYVLRKLGEENAEASLYMDSSDQNTQGTVIVYANIPVKYISVKEA